MSTYTTAWVMRQSPVSDAQFRALFWLAECGADDGAFYIPIAHFVMRMQTTLDRAMFALLSLEPDFADINVRGTIIEGKLRIETAVQS